MAIDLQNPTNIGTGWGRPPDYSAPNIGGLVGDILKNRIAQQELQQRNISDAIKQYQSQKSDAAYIQAAQNAGVLPQGDYSGMTSREASDLAQRIQAMTPDTQRDALLKAQTDAINRGEGRGGSRGPRPFTQGQQFNALKTQQSLLGKQAGEIEEEQAGYGLKPDVPGGFGYMQNPDKTWRYATTPEEQAKPDLVSPVDILGANKKEYEAGSVPTFTQDIYKQRQAQSTLRQQKLAEQKAVQAKMLAPPTDGSAGGGGDGGGGGIDRLRAQAQDAIKQGAPADAVSQKFREMTGQEL